MTVAAPESPVSEDYPLSLCEICRRPYLKREAIQSFCHLSCYYVHKRRMGKFSGKRGQYMKSAND